MGFKPRRGGSIVRALKRLRESHIKLLSVGGQLQGKTLEMWIYQQAVDYLLLVPLEKASQQKDNVYIRVLLPSGRLGWNGSGPRPSLGIWQVRVPESLRSKYHLYLPMRSPGNFMKLCLCFSRPSILWALSNWKVWIFFQFGETFFILIFDNFFLFIFSLGYCNS